MNIWDYVEIIAALVLVLFSIMVAAALVSGGIGR